MGNKMASIQYQINREERMKFENIFLNMEEKYFSAGGRAGINHYVGGQFSFDLGSDCIVIEGEKENEIKKEFSELTMISKEEIN
jgi:hypothetical protein